jgi:hypothetical protein
VGKYYKLMDDWLIEYLVILYRMYNEYIDGMFRAVFWVILPCKMFVDQRFRGAYCLHHPIPEDNSEHHTRRHENLKSHSETSVDIQLRTR